MWYFVVALIVLTIIVALDDEEEYDIYLLVALLWLPAFAIALLFVPGLLIRKGIRHVQAQRNSPK